MKTVSIMQAQHNLSEVLRSLRQSGRIGITRHKKLVAELVEPSVIPAPIFPDFQLRARKTWGETWEGIPSEDLLHESRGER